MAKGLFESPKKALLFVGMTVLSVVMLVGTEDEQGALVKAASTIDSPEVDYSDGVERFGPPPSQQAQAETDIDMSSFGSDEDLIDTAEGFDPTPDEIEPYEPETDLGASDAFVIEGG